MKKKGFFVGMLTVMLAFSLRVVGCSTTVPVTYTEAARLDISGVKRVAIESNDAQVANSTSQQLSATGKYTVASAAELEEWKQWSERGIYQAPAIEISAVDLASAYQANVARADSSYKEKVLKIAGTVKELGQGSKGSYYMRLVAGSDSVDIYFRPSELEKFKSVDKGQTVTVVGDCHGRNLPDMEDTAEILRILGAGSSVNVINAIFPVGDYPGTVDAVISVNKDASTQEGTRTEKQQAVGADGKAVVGADGKAVQRDVTIYERSVTVNINYQITRTRDGSPIGQGTKSATSSKSSNEDRSELASPADLEANTIVKPLQEFISEIVPTQRSVSITLAKDESGAKGAKEAKKEMSEAQNLVKAKNYNAAATAYSKIYAQYDNFAAGYNQAVLMETAEGTGAAIVLMEALANKTGNSLAQNTLQQMQSRNASNQKAAEQLAQ
jgi:hypothetical protein